MHEAIKYEISRQSQLAAQGKKISNETLGFDNRSKKTFVMRDKEIVQDYRFMPEPNLPPILLTEGDDVNSGLLNIKEIDHSLQRHLLPESIRKEYQHIDSLGLGQLYFLQNNKILREIFKEIFEESQRKNKASEIVDFLLQFVTIGEESTGFVPELDRLPKLVEVFERIGSKWLAELIDLRLDRRISPQTSIDLIKFYLQYPKESEKVCILITG